MDPLPASAIEREIVRQAARDQDMNRYLAALLAPREARADLVTLAAVMGELARIPRIAQEPRMASIRLEWWYEALQGGIATANPVADAAIEMLRRRGFGPGLLLGTIDALAGLLEAPPSGDEPSIWATLGRTESGGFRLAARILGVAAAADADRTIDLAGESYAMAHLLLGGGPAPAILRPLLTARPRPHWLDATRRRRDEVRTRLIGAPRALHAALRPLALVEPYLRALEGGGTERGAIAPLTRAWTLWRARLTGRI